MDSWLPVFSFACLEFKFLEASVSKFNSESFISVSWNSCLWFTSLKHCQENGTVILKEIFRYIHLVMIIYKFWKYDFIEMFFLLPQLTIQFFIICFNRISNNISFSIVPKKDCEYYYEQETHDFRRVLMNRIFVYHTRI